MSVRGGLQWALYRGKAAGCQVIQFFSRNNNRWLSGPLTEQEITAFRKARQDTSVEPVAIHDSYLINLASARAEVRRKSVQSLLEEILRAAELDIASVVIHPGAHGGEGEKTGIRRIAEALNRIHERTPGLEVKILLETMAGQGSSLGYRLEQLAEIMELTEDSERLGICLDTCHTFAAGYDFQSPETYSRFMEAFSRVVGLDKLSLVHMNDSKKKLGSRVDRHEHLGLGYLRKQAFSLFLNDPRLAQIPFLIETPKGEKAGGVDWDAANLGFLRSLVVEDHPNDRF
jgi:deoxyribonuclease-4